MKKNTKKKKTDLRVLLPVCIVLPLLAILAGALIFSLFTGGPEPVGEAYLQAMTAKDGDGVLEMYHGSMLMHLQKVSGEKASVITARFQNRLEAWYDNAFGECGDNVTFTYELSEETDVDEETLTELKEIIGEGVSSAVTFKGEITATGSKGSKTATHWVQLVEVDGKWFLYNLQMLL